MALLIINGVTLPEPTEYRVMLQDFDGENTSRSETGMLHRDRIRSGVYKIEVGWIVTKEQLKIIIDAVTSARFSVNFFDPTKSSRSTAWMYVGDRSGSLKANAKNGNESLWYLSFSLIEY